MGIAARSHGASCSSDPSLAGIGRTACGCAADEELRSLSPTQFDILELLALGLTNASIAEQRGIALKTVEMHVNKIYVGLGLEADSTYNARVRAAVRFAQAKERAPHLNA